MAWLGSVVRRNARVFFCLVIFLSDVPSALSVAEVAAVRKSVNARGGLRFGNTMTRVHQFSVLRLLAAISLVNVMCVISAG